MAENTVEIRLLARDAASAVLRDVDQQIRGIVGSLAAFAAASVGIGAVVRAGFGFNKTLEDTKNGIAGILGVYREYSDEQGRVLTGQRAFAAAQAETATIQAKLAGAALSTTASYTEMVEAFQVGVGPMQRAGVALSDTVALTQRLTQAAGALGIPMAQLGLEIRQFMAGDEQRSALMQRLGITKEMIDEWTRSGTIFQEVIKRTESIGLAAAAASQSFSGGLSNLKDAFEQFAGKAFAGLYEEAKTTVFELQKLFVDIVPTKGGGFTAVFNKDLLDAFESVSSAAVEVGRTIKETFGEVFETLTDGLKRNGASWKDVFVALGLAVTAVVETLSTGVKFIATALSAPIDTAKAVFHGFFSLVLQGAAAAVGGLVRLLGPVAPDKLKQAAADIGKLADEEALKIGNLFDAFGDPYKHTKKLADTLGTYKEAAKGAAEETRGLSKDLGGSGESAEEAAKRIAKLKKASDEYAQSIEKIRQQGQAELPNLYKLVGWGDLADETSLANQFAAAQKTIAEFGFAVGKDMSALYEALLVWEGDASRALADPFKKALPQAKSYAAAVTNGLRSAAEQARYLSAALLALGRPMEAAIEAIKAEAASMTQVVYENALAAWDSMGRAFDETFYSAMTGRLDSLKDVFKGWSDSIYQGYSKLLASMVKDWAASGMSRLFGTGWAGTGEASVFDEATGTWQTVPSTSSSNRWSNPNNRWNQTGVALGGTALGIAGQMAQNKGAQESWQAASMGFSIGSQFYGIIGGAIGALVGAIVTWLTPGEKEIKGSFGLPGQVGTTPGLNWGDTAEQRKAMDSMVKTRDDFASSFAEMFRKVNAGTAKEQTDLLKKAWEQFLKTSPIFIHAGSGSDFAANVESILKSEFPRTLLKLAFGWTLEGIKNLAGIEGMPGLTGGPTADSPMGKMLTELGVTAQKFNEIASMIDYKDPEKFVEWLKSFVEVVVGVRDLVAEMGKSGVEVLADFEKRQKAPDAAVFEESATNMLAMVEELSLLTGDEQLARAKEVIAAVEERYQKELEAIARIKDLMDQMGKSLSDFGKSIDQFLAGEENFLWKAAGTVYGAAEKIAAASSSTEVANIVNEALNAAQALFNDMTAKLQAAKGVLASIGEVITEIRARNLGESDLGTFTGIWRSVIDLQRQAAEAAKLTGKEQIAAMARIGASAREIWGAIQASIIAVRENAKALSASIEQQRYDLKFSLLNPQDQAQSIADRIEELKRRLAYATSPAEVQAITEMIQALVRQYVGLFGENDPNRVDAFAWADKVLADLEAAALRVYATMTDSLQNAADQMADILDGISETLGGVITGLEQDLRDLAGVIDWIRKVMEERMGGLVQEILDTNEALKIALQDFLNGLLGVNNLLDDGGGDTGDTGDDGDRVPRFTEGLTRATGGVEAFADALDRVTELLGGTPSGGAPAAPQRPGTAAAGQVVAYTIAAVEGQIQARGVAYGARLTGR